MYSTPMMPPTWATHTFFIPCRHRLRYIFAFAECACMILLPKKERNEVHPDIRPVSIPPMPFSSSRIALITNPIGMQRVSYEANSSPP
jgi:hypothetical protein